MICVLSQSYLEPTTEAVIDWLRYWGIPYIRINGSDIDGNGGPFFSINTDSVTSNLIVDGVSIDQSKIKVVWYRRWAFENKHRNGKLFVNESHNTLLNALSINLHLYHELMAHSEYFFSMLGSAKWLGHPSTSEPNKLHVLRLAAELGLDIPDTLVTSQTDELRRFVEKHGEVIVKPASDGLMFQLDDDHNFHTTYTTVVPDEIIEGEAWSCEFPSLFQEKLKKKYEIRTFYLDGKCFSMAMFTQRSTQTSVDFRKYESGQLSRSVPYKLPSSIEASIQSLMTKLNLDTGSIDLVRTFDNRYVFLEVNPVGQFGMVSIPCNYFLEKQVAGKLVERLYGTKNQNEKDLQS